jgi:hypothetical protein
MFKKNSTQKEYIELKGINKDYKELEKESGIN